MHFIASILSLVFTATLLCASIVVTSAGEAQQEGKRYDAISFVGRTDFKISDPALVPRQLALAAEQAGCRYKEDIEELPIHFIGTDDRRLALVFCRSGASGSHYVFDLENLRKPKLAQLPFIAQKEGFGATYRPGLITWKREAGVFQAETGSDMCPNSELRHTYRLGSTGGMFSRAASFVIVRVEVREKPCGQNTEWTTVWEAPTWPGSVVIR